ncbi:hypothetical protein ABL78_4560 [Leptomonas seymouri]|uniref:Uncharacterized protein n=1 Tax=Leptomonas seymouri TaxID=5684 RepID=A0A0N1HY12_LEPSE|nr:hypothetical protein ABL78_4560 [Leptomonas seymouri]|eukprot:KPI86374.1 hypothetical protein ABL78_4560 [Leptomonas seymouri]
MQQDHCGTAMVAPLHAEKMEMYNPCGPSLAVGEVPAPADLAHAVARYVRRRCRRAHALAPHGVHQIEFFGANALSASSWEDVPDQDEAEEAHLIAVSQLAEAQLLQCLLHVRLNPNEVPSQSELPGDYCVAVSSTEGAAFTPPPVTKGEGSSSDVSGDEEVNQGKPASTEKTITRPSGTVHSPSPRPPNPLITTDYEHSTAGDYEAEQRRAYDRKKSTHASDMPIAPPAAPSSRLSSSPMSPSGAKAKELYYAYTHQSVPPPRAPSQLAAQSSTRSLGAARSGVAPAHPNPSPSTAAVTADNRMERQVSRARASQEQRSSQLEEGKGRRWHSASGRARHRSEDDEVPAGVGNAGGEGGSQKAVPASHRTRRGTIQPLTPAELAAAVGSWPSRIMQYTLATKLAEAALSSPLVGSEGSVKKTACAEGEDNQNVKEREAAEGATATPPPRPPPPQDNAKKRVEDNSELRELIQRIRDALQYTNLATSVTRLSFPSFARFYLSDPALPTVHGEGNNGSAPRDAVVERCLAQLTDALVSAAVVPDVEEAKGEKFSDVNNNGGSHGSSEEEDAEEEEESLVFTGDMVMDTELLLRHTPTILAASSSPKLKEAQPKNHGRSGSLKSARSVARRALRRLLHLAPSWHNGTMCTTPLVVGVLRRYKPQDTSSSCALDGGAPGLRIRLVPAAELGMHGGTGHAAALSTTEESSNATLWFYNALLIEVTGHDVAYTPEVDGEATVDADALPLEDEEGAKTIFHDDVPDTHRRQWHQQQQRIGRESSVGVETRDVDTGVARRRLSRQQCATWQQLLTLAQFIHVAGTPTQVEMTARYVALAIRRRREARHEHHHRRQSLNQSLLLSSAVPVSGGAAAASPIAQPSIAESAVPVSVPAFFFTLTQTSLQVAAEAAATRVLQYDEGEADDTHHEPQPIQPGRVDVRSRTSDGDEGKGNSKRGVQLQQTDAKSSGGASSASSLVPPRHGLFSGPGLSLRALLGWRSAPPPSPSAAATVTALPSMPKPSFPSDTSPSFSPLSVPRAADTAIPTTAVVSSTDDLIMKWMYDTLIPIFYETTVMCSEAGEVDGTGAAPLGRPASSSGEAVATAGGKTSSANNSNSGNRHRYRLRRQRVLLGRVQVITASMVHRDQYHSDGDVMPSDLSAAHGAHAIHVDGETTAITEAQLLYYLLLNQLFFDTAVPASNAADEAAVDEVSPASRSQWRRARSAPSSKHPADELRRTECKSSPQASPHPRQRRALSATPQRRVCFHEDAKRGTPHQRTAQSKAPAEKWQQHSEAMGSESFGAPTAAAPASTTRLGSLSPSPKSILKSGWRYKAEKLVRSSAPAVSVVPFRSFLLWRWLAAEVLTPPAAAEPQRNAAAPEEEKPDEGKARSLRVAGLSPTLHLGSAAYLAEAQTLAVRVASDVAAMLLLSGLQAEQYTCHRQLQQKHYNEKNGCGNTKGPPAATAGDKSEGNEDELGPPPPPGADVLEGRHEAAFQCDDILPLAKGVAEAVVRAALAPVVYVGFMPQQLQSVGQDVDVAESESSGDEGDDFDAESVATSKGQLRGKNVLGDNPELDDDGGCGSGPSDSGPAISVLSPTLPPDVFQRFQALSVLCLYRVQRETLESVTRPLDLALRRLTWCLAQHRLHLLCQPLLQFWEADDMAALTEMAATALSPFSSVSLSKTSAEAKTLLERCAEAEDGLRFHVCQVLQLYEECYVLPHLLTAAGAPHAVGLRLGEEADVAKEGSFDAHVAHSHNSEGGERAPELCKRCFSPLAPLHEECVESPLLPTRGSRVAASTLHAVQQQQSQRSVNAFVPLCFGTAKITQKASMATFTTPAEMPMSPQQQSQATWHASLPNWSGMAALSAWNPVAVDSSFDLHSSVCCDWRSMRLSGGGGGGSIGAAANDFAAAVVASSSLRVPSVAASHATGSTRPHSTNSSPNILNATTTTATNTTTTVTAITAATDSLLSTSDALLSVNYLTSTVPASHSERLRSIGRRGRDAEESSPAEASIDMPQQQQQPQLRSVGFATQPNLMQPTAAPTLQQVYSPVTSDVASHVASLFEGLPSSIAAADSGAPTRHRFSSRWLKLMPYQEQWQQQQHQQQQRGLYELSFLPSFVTFRAVTPIPPRFHGPIAGANTRRKTAATVAREAKSAPRDTMLQSTKPPTSVAPSGLSIPTARPAATVTAVEENGSSGAADVDVPTPTAECTGPALSQSHSFFTAQLRMGSVIESRLLSPFVEETKCLLVSSLLQNWVLPRWGTLTQLGAHAVRQAKGTRDPLSLEGHCTPASLQADIPSGMQEHQGQHDVVLHPSEHEDAPHYRYHNSGEVVMSTAKPSVDAAATPVAASAISIPPLSPLASPAPPQNEDSKNGKRADGEHVKEECYALQARMQNMQEALNEIFQACRDLTAATRQYELALVLEDPKAPSTAVLIPHEVAGGAPVDPHLTHRGKQPWHEMPPQTCSLSVTLPASSENVSATSPPLSYQPPPTPPPPPSSAASHEFLRKTREQRERILALCKRMLSLLVATERYPARKHAKREESVPPPRLSKAQRAGDGAPQLHESPSRARVASLGSLSQCMRGPPCPILSDSSVASTSDQQQHHQHNSFLGSGGPSQLFSPLLEPIRRSSTAFTLISAPAPLIDTPSNTANSTLSSREDVTGSVLSSNVLIAVPVAMDPAEPPLQLDDPKSQRRCRSNSVGEVLPQVLSPTSLHKKVVVVLKEEEVSLRNVSAEASHSTEGAASTAQPPERSYLNESAMQHDAREDQKDSNVLSATAQHNNISAPVPPPTATAEGEPTELQLRGLTQGIASPISETTARHDCAQQTLPGGPSTRYDAGTQTLSFAYTEQHHNADERESQFQSLEVRSTARSEANVRNGTRRSEGVCCGDSLRSIETAEVTPYKHHHHHHGSNKRSGGKTAEEATVDGNTGEVADDHSSSDDDDYSSSTLSPVSEHSSNRLSNAIVSGSTSPLPSTVFLSSTAAVAASALFEGQPPQQQQQQQRRQATSAGDQSWNAAGCNEPNSADEMVERESDAGRRVGGWQRPASPLPAPHVARCISLPTQSHTPSPSPTHQHRTANETGTMQDATDKHECAEGSEDEDAERLTEGVYDGSSHAGAPQHVDTTVAEYEVSWPGLHGGSVNASSVKAAEETQIANAKTHTARQATTTVLSSSSSPWRERTPARSSEAAVTALADLQQRLGGSNSTVIELRQQLQRAEANARAQEQAMAHLQWQLEKTAAALHRSVASQEAELERMQLHPPPPLTPLRRSAAMNTVDTYVQSERQQPLLSPSVSSSPPKAELRTAQQSHGRAASEGSNGDLETRLMEKIDAGVQVHMAESLSMRDAAKASAVGEGDAAASSRSTPAGPSLTASHTSAEQRVRELEADMRNATFRMEQWRALLEAERHARAVQVDSLSQQLEIEQRWRQRRENSRSVSRDRSPPLFESAWLPSTAGVDTATSSSCVHIAPPSRFTDQQPSPRYGERRRSESLSPVNWQDSSANMRDAEEQRVAAALTQQAEELKEREEGLKRRIASVLDRLHTAETRLEEQQQQQSVCEAAAREDERRKLELHVATLQRELEAARLRNLENAELIASHAHTRSHRSSNTEAETEDVGVQTSHVCAVSQDSTSTTAAREAEQVGEEMEPRAAQQRLQEELLEEPREQEAGKSLHSTAVAALRRDLEERSRDAQMSRESLIEEREAHGRTKVILEETVAAMALARAAHKAKETLLQQDTAEWWTAFVNASAEWTKEKALLIHSAYGGRLQLQEQQLHASMVSAMETERMQSETLSALRTALTAAREDAAAREGDLQREVSAMKRDATALAATHAAATSLRQLRAAQEAHLREDTATWWSAWEACTTQWMGEKSLLISDTYQRQLQAREQQQLKLEAGMQGEISDYASTIESLRQELSLARHEAKHLNESLKTHVTAHERAVEEVSRVHAAHIAAQEAVNSNVEKLVCRAAAWWTSRESCLVLWAEATASLLENTYESMLRVQRQKQGEAAGQLAVMSARHEEVLGTLRKQLADARQADQEGRQTLRKEEEAHTRTVTALQAMQAASAAVRKAEVSQQDRLQRSTAAWWGARGGCVLDWMEAKVRLVESTYDVQQRLYQDIVSAAMESARRTVKGVSTHATREKGVQADAVLNHHKGRSPRKAGNDRITRGAAEGDSPRGARSPDVVMMSLEDPLGLRYELQRKTRRIHSLEEHVQQLEAAHIADQQALIALRALLQQERSESGSLLPTGATITRANGAAAVPSSNRSHAWPPAPPSPPNFSVAFTPSRAPPRGWGEEVINEGPYLTPSRSTDLVKSRRLTPSEYRQRFAGM